MTHDYRTINKRVMTDTVNCVQTIPELIAAVQDSISRQFMVAQEDNIDQPAATQSRTKYIVSGERSFEAAKKYAGKKVAVLNFANNHAVGGAPFSAGAQEESLCRCSTLYPCLAAMDAPFYRKHVSEFMAGRLSYEGSDDLIYTPDVVVFKTDERTDPIEPKLMAQKDWYKVDIITCAAPEYRNKPKTFPAGYRDLISRRIKKILDVAAQQKDEVLILGAWGCGAFGNSTEVVASVFMELLANYDFETVEFALSSGDGTGTPFAREIAKKESTASASNTAKPCTPARITSLATNEIFVFGSNKEGNHLGGAAAAAAQLFGAQWGVGVGRTGQCYAIPTMDGSLDLIAEYVEGFRCYAACHPELTFYVTPIGCGIAGWTEEQIAPLFAFAHNMANVILPKGW